MLRQNLSQIRDIFSISHKSMNLHGSLVALKMSLTKLQVHDQTL